MAENDIKVPCDLDKDSVEFLESKLGSKINPHLETEKDYYQAIFYFKCCALQKEAGTENPSNKNFSVRDCFFSKEKADLLFENVYEHAMEFKKITENLESDMSLMDKFMQYAESGMSAQTATLNEHLTPHLHNFKGDRDIGNALIMHTISLQQFSGYLNAFPDLAQKMNENYSAVVTQAAADIAPSLPKNANLDEYLPVIKEHPKAVLALAVTAKANKEVNVPTTIDSPEDLLKKSQHPTILALSDKISFNDLQGSMKTTYKEAQAVIGLGRENTDIPTISRAKVNEG